METREWKTIKEYQDILFDFLQRNSENHHQPSALPQRVHPHHHFGNQRRPVLLPRVPGYQCSGSDRSRRQSLLQRGRYARKGAWRLYRHRWSSPSECAGRTKANPVTA